LQYNYALSKGRGQICERRWFRWSDSKTPALQNFKTPKLQNSKTSKCQNSKTEQLNSKTQQLNNSNIQQLTHQFTHPPPPSLTPSSPTHSLNSLNIQLLQNSTTQQVKTQQLQNLTTQQLPSSHPTSLLSPSGPTSLPYPLTHSLTQLPQNLKTPNYLHNLLWISMKWFRSFKVWRPGAWFTKQTYNNFYPKFLVKQRYNVF